MHYAGQRNPFRQPRTGAVEQGQVTGVVFGQCQEQTPGFGRPALPVQQIGQAETGFLQARIEPQCFPQGGFRLCRLGLEAQAVAQGTVRGGKSDLFPDGLLQRFFGSRIVAGFEKLLPA